MLLLKNKMKKSYVVVLHVFYWLLRFTWGELADYLFITGYQFDWASFITPLSIGEYIVFMVPFYLNYFWVMPAFFKKGRMTTSWVAWVWLVVLFIFFRYFVEEFLFTKLFGSHNYNPRTTLWFYVFDNVYFGTVIIVSSIFIWATVHWKTMELEKNILAKAMVDAELKLLRSQVNPHFLFNTLNNIYSLIYHRSDKALPAIMKLSDLMRFMTNESLGDRIELDKEIGYIKSYIELEQLRASGSPTVSFTITGNITAWKIAPLLLIPLIENGFKHGIITDRKHPYMIEIRVNGNELDMITTNRINNSQKALPGGIGLSNVRQRLELLYPSKHTLQVERKDDIYICKLHIKLQKL